MTRSYGWRPDKPDYRDRKFGGARVDQLPPSIDLTQHCPAVYDQGDLGSCTANAIAAAIEFDLFKQGGVAFMPSRLFVYYNERQIEGTVDYDAGAEIRDGVKSVNAVGVCPEPLWPYDIDKFTKKPLRRCYRRASFSKTLQYERVGQDLTSMRQCISSGYPFIVGFSCYTAFESDEVAKTGILNMPLDGEVVVGGHAVLVVGYDDVLGVFRVMNSWGKGWGQSGYFTMPYQYLNSPDLSGDFWTIRLVQ